MIKGLHITMYAFLLSTTAIIISTLGSIVDVQAQGQYETEVKQLLSAFLGCWNRALAYGGPQYMSANEQFVCGALMSNSHAALNHIYNAGTLSTYSQETQILAYHTAVIIAPYVLPGGSAGTPTDAITSSMPSTVSDSFFEYLGKSSGSYLTGGRYGDVCNYTLGTCTVTDSATGAISDIPWTSIAEENVVDNDE
jgi:hypothetical protein